MGLGTQAQTIESLKEELVQRDLEIRALRAYSSDRGQRFHSDGGHHSTLMADSFSHALEALPSVS